MYGTMRATSRVNSAEAVLHAGGRRREALFLDAGGGRPCHGSDDRWTQEGWRDLVLFHEDFHGDTGKGLGATHQTGWTALV